MGLKLVAILQDGFLQQFRTGSRISGTKTVVAHSVASMSGEQNPSKSLGKPITGVDHPGKVLHNNIPLFAPFLNGEMLDFDMTRTRSGSGFVDHIERSNIVDQQTSWTRTERIKFRQYIAKILDDLGSGNGRIEFSLRRTGGDDRLNSALPCECGPGS